ncbi:hypothetical protein IWZ03DRAFT_25869 [Phyllosticta citriasiana]|uniref:Uncharacterized protein n=1 Tax=Phyllosticta citriasiana TaxID=595635 RepID=A0ABR1L088_9PEZI
MNPFRALACKRHHVQPALSSALRIHTSAHATSSVIRAFLQNPWSKQAFILPTIIITIPIGAPFLANTHTSQRSLCAQAQASTSARHCPSPPQTTPNHVALVPQFCSEPLCFLLYLFSDFSLLGFFFFFFFLVSFSIVLLIS